jgi:hypothetical protein
MCKCVSSKFLNLECKVLALGVQNVLVESFEIQIDGLYRFVLHRNNFVMHEWDHRLYSTAMYSSGCYRFRVQSFELGLDLEVQHLKCPTRKFLG